MSDEVSHLIIKVSSDTVAQATRNLDSLSKASDKVMGLIKGLVTAAAALAVFKQAAGAIAEFEKNMSGVQAVTGATTVQMKELSDAAREFGSTTQYSAQQAAEAMKFLGQAGFSTEQILKTMPGMLDLATAGELDLASAADITSAALAGFRLQAADSAKVADILAVAAGESNTSVFQMGDAMKYVAPIAAGMNKSIEEVSAAIGVLSNAGLQGSMAGTGLRQVLSSLATPTKEAADTLRAYGIKIDEVNPEIHSLSEVIHVLAKANISASDALVIAGDRGGSALQALTSQVPSLDKLNKSMSNVQGRAREMSKVMGDNLAGDFLKLKNSSNELFLALGEAGLKDALREATKATTQFITAISDLVKSGEAAAWVDLFLSKLDLLADGFYNASANIAEVWAMTMEYINGTGKEAADDITSAFKNMPENIRALVQAIGASFGLLVEYAGHTANAADQIFNAFFDGIITNAKNFGKTLKVVFDPTTSVAEKIVALNQYIEDNKKVTADLGTVAKKTWTDYKANLQGATDAWQDEIAAILDERDTNVASSDAKLKKIEELRAAYAKLREARLKSEAGKDDKGGTPGNPPAPGGDDGPAHFNTQEFENLRKQLQLEEKTVQESYDIRLDLIMRNTKKGSDLQLSLTQALNDRLLVEQHDAEMATQERLDMEYKARQDKLQTALDNRLITEQQFLDASRENWKKYTNDVVTLTDTGARVISTKQLETYSAVLGLAADISSQLSGLVGENNDAAKAMFIASKAIAIAQAIVYTELAATKALAEGGLFLGIPMSAVIRGLGYASVAVMAASAIGEYGGKFEHGGMIGAGKVGLVGETGLPELVKGPAVVTSARSTAAMMGRGGSGTEVTVNIINNAGAQVQTRERDTLDGKVIDIMVDKIDKQLAGNMRAGRGQLPKAFESAYGQRRGTAS